MVDFAKIKAAANAAVKNVKTNMHDTKSTSYTLPAQGKALARLVGVVEIGEHEVTGGPTNVPKIKDRIRFIFELFGKRYPRVVGDDGTEYAPRISRTLTNSRHEKSTMAQWVAEMDRDHKYSHPVQMIGDAFIVDIEHKEFQDGKVAYIKSVSRAVQVDMDTGEETPMEVPESLLEPMIYVWAAPSLDMWNSLYTPGEYDGRSKNVLQDAITEALNFEGSPTAKMLAEAVARGEKVLGVEGADAEAAAEPARPAARATASAASLLDDEADETPPVPVAAKPASPKPAAKPAAAPAAAAEAGEDEPAMRPVVSGKAASRLAALIGKK